MARQTCSRCHKEEYIPTHQYVKFDATVYFVCVECWELFRAWFFRGPNAMFAPKKDVA